MSSDESNSAQLLAHYEGGPKANSPRLGGLKREQLNAAEGGGQHCVWPLLLPAARSACLPAHAHCSVLGPKTAWSLYARSLFALPLRHWSLCARTDARPSATVPHRSTMPPCFSMPPDLG